MLLPKYMKSFMMVDAPVVKLIELHMPLLDMCCASTGFSNIGRPRLCPATLTRLAMPQLMWPSFHEVDHAPHVAIQ